VAGTRIPLYIALARNYGLSRASQGLALRLIREHEDDIRTAIRQVLNVERPARHHLFWPDLDVDLEVDSLRHPNLYPLVSRAGIKQHAVREPVARATTVKKRKRPSKRS
jgi:hypothetical protein